MPQTKPQSQQPNETTISSSMAAATATTTNKKRFGTNANKLAKPAAPPIPNDKSDRNAKNGLLLLSTKKGASSTNTPSASGGGLLASKTSSTSNNTHSALLSAVGGGVDAQQNSAGAPDAWGVAADKQNLQQQVTSQEQQQKDNESSQKSGAPSEQKVETSNDGDAKPARSEPDASWDEYGGRGTTNSSSADAGANTSTDQVAYMSKLAKERAEKRRQEEEAREAEQREKAARRLRALEEKMQNTAGSSSSNSAAAPDEQAWNANSRGQKAPTRTLWDPDKGKHVPVPVPREKHTRGRGGESQPQKSAPVATETPQEESSDEPLIHLTSYDDRDRGEQRVTSAAPRMLFDPKSGSMVAVKARGEGGGAGSGPNGAGTDRSSRRKERKARSRKDKSDRDHSTERTTKSGRKKGRNKDEDTLTLAKKSDSKKKSVNPNRKLPRTCGVLYARDAKGNIYCADDCEGDLGYGAHSVPGGRARNPDAYAEFLEHQELQHRSGYPNNEMDEDYQNHYDNTHNIDNDVALQTGLDLEEAPPVMEWVTADDKLELVTGVDDSPTLKPTARTWAPTQAALALAARQQQTGSLANSNDSGDDDDLDDEDEGEESSEQHAAGLGIDPTQDMDFMSSPDAVGVEAATDPVDALKSLDLGALATLDAPMYSSSDANDPVDSEKRRPRHIFAFGSSETWASSSAANKDNQVGGWGALTGNGSSNNDNNKSNPVGGLFSSDIFGSSEDTKDSTAAPTAGPFLSLSSLPDATGSWGSGLAGLGAKGPTNGEASGRAVD